MHDGGGYVYTQISFQTDSKTHVHVANESGIGVASPFISSPETPAGRKHSPCGYPS